MRWREIVLLMLLSMATDGFAKKMYAQAAVRVRLGTLAPKGSSYHQILLSMAEKWRQAPGGGVSLTIFSDGSMGGEADMVRRMRVGQIQSGLLTVVGLSAIDPSVSALQDMPMMFHSLDEVDYVRQKLSPTIEKKVIGKGVCGFVLGRFRMGAIFFQATRSLPGRHEENEVIHLGWRCPSAGYHEDRGISTRTLGN